MDTKESPAKGQIRQVIEFYFLVALFTGIFLSTAMAVGFSLIISVDFLSYKARKIQCSYDYKEYLCGTYDIHSEGLPK